MWGIEIGTKRSGEATVVLACIDGEPAMRVAKVFQAGRAGGGLPGLADDRNGECGQDGCDRHDHKEFGEREAADG